ncbi:hypothetical protein [Pectobacterium phage Jarilo]|uniref:Uncharacterized protein n=1 Tax=Pectobacterium phage Jarilo TaxID=2163634 RepID=A0A2S1GSW5_9CAUD|nr:hypothetical protein HOT17_gp07 [Pectobacterium phage Jarilo]AWD92488.1 hypothetical protein [Pectobacterium phage Jarilo]
MRSLNGTITTHYQREAFGSPFAFLKGRINNDSLLAQRLKPQGSYHYLKVQLKGVLQVMLSIHDSIVLGTITATLFGVGMMIRNAFKSATMENLKTQQDRNVTLNARLFDAQQELKVLKADHNELVKLFDWRAGVIARQEKDLTYAYSTIEKLKAELDEPKCSGGTPELSSVKFRAVMPNGDIRDTVFKLGLGPCGKVVTRLSLDVVGPEGDFVIRQVTEDQEIKTFTYKKWHIAGRVEQSFK